VARTDSRARLTLLVSGVGLALFVLVLVLWVGSAPARPSIDAGAAPPSSTGGVGTQAPSSTAPSSGSTSPSGPGSLNDLLKNNPLAAANTPDAGGLPTYDVQIVVTSDARIARFGYYVVYGNPTQYSANWLNTPLVINTQGRSAGLVAFAAAQAAPDATYITCTLKVNGVVKSTRTVHGGYRVTACIG